MYQTEKELARCPACGQLAVSFTEENREFQHGDVGAPVTLTALMPIGHCASCGLEYLDKRAERAQQAAICLYENLLTPEQIEGIRKVWGMSRRDFSNLARIGEASLSRWERGTGVQNPALDQLLYLLQFTDNVRRLRERSSVANHVIHFTHIQNITEKSAEASQWQLHKPYQVRNVG